MPTYIGIPEMDFEANKWVYTSLFDEDFYDGVSKMSQDPPIPLAALFAAVEAMMERESGDNE
ncbi:hypothetical protein Slin15195_G046180 [Septoria linicola]|uniref:Uncharacterized protein n=1 Tax=Septoria linicola TaxID=215465 RepID=A0A9Q9EIP1_9PEZI|nr:hypothetical protein Slin14017_G049710 [Septoria linicola]USW51299.1 hypothetical protein Slin15195_G046180 [Septoria linicola]